MPVISWDDVGHDRVFMAARWAGNGGVVRGATIVLVVLAGFAGGAGRLQAQLPSLTQSPWIGYFAGHTGTRGMCGISADGSLYYNHADDLGSVGSGSPHRIYPAVRETLPDGKSRVHRLLPETLKSETEPTDKTGKVSYRGQVKSGAKESLVLRRLDGKSFKQPLLDSVDLSSSDFNGDGFNMIEAGLDWFQCRKIRIPPRNACG